MPQSDFKQDRIKCYKIFLGTDRPSFFPKLRLLIMHFGLHCVAIYRFGQYASRVRNKHRLIGICLRAIHFWLDMLTRFFHHVRLEVDDIGPGLFIQHTGTIYIAAERIGSNFSVTHNVTIGIGYQKGGMGVPTIGDNVWVGTGAIISGAINIGDSVSISSGSVLSRDVPSRCLVAGFPARVIQAEYDNAHYFGPEECAKHQEQRQKEENLSSLKSKSEQ